MILASMAARPLLGQAAVATDLWRVVQGTLTRPMALSAGGTATMWTPAVRLDTAIRWRVGVEAVHAPAETGVQSGYVGVAMRRGLTTFHAGYGRIGVNDVAATETSPETIGGDVPIWSQSASMGLAVEPLPGLTAGAALRYVSGRLGPERHAQAGVDVGVRYEGFERLRLGFATQFFDPSFGESARGSVYSMGSEYAFSPWDAWGAGAQLSLRYGLVLQSGERAQQLLIGGLVVGRLGVDWGVAHENAFGRGLWRSRFGINLGAGGYRVDIGRDGGANDFGATWRFGVTGDFR